LWALGAAVVGVGAWLALGKKASAQSDKPQLVGAGPFVWSYPVSPEGMARMAALTEEDLAEINRIAALCLPSGRFEKFTVEELRSEHSNSERILLGYKTGHMHFLVATVPFDRAAALACINQGL
jgi:hypothetical protein